MDGKSIEKMRAKFEAAYCEQFGRLPIGWNSEIERYMDAHAAGAWWAWQASRASLVVALP